MTAIHRRSHRSPVSIAVVLATADDLNGVQDLTQSYDITGASRCFIMSMIATPGTTGIDVVAISHNGGASWTAVDDLLIASANDATGDVQAGGAMEAAGVEPITVPTALFKCGPYEGPTAIRVFRYVTEMTGSAAWTTGAPSVYLVTVGQTSGSPVALA